MVFCDWLQGRVRRDLPEMVDSATLAELDGPQGIALDGSGNLYIADAANDVIRRVDSTGVITTVAGNGSAGFGGDQGAATAALLNEPVGVAVDAAGTLYLADAGNNRLRRVSITGTITTLAGDGNDAANGDGGPASYSELSAYGVTMDGSGNLYIADKDNNLVREVSGASSLLPAPTMTLTSSAAMVNSGETVTLSVTVTGSNPVPTGTVSFQNVSTDGHTGFAFVPSATIPLVNGQVTLSTLLWNGMNSLSAVYSGGHELLRGSGAGDGGFGYAGWAD